MKSLTGWVKNLIRAFSALIAVFFFLGTGFQGGSSQDTMAGLAIVAAAAMIAFAPERLLAQQGGRVVFSIVVLIGLLGCSLWIWDSLTSFSPPDYRGASISVIGLLSLSVGLVRLLPESKEGALSVEP